MKSIYNMRLPSARGIQFEYLDGCLLKYRVLGPLQRRKGRNQVNEPLKLNTVRVITSPIAAEGPPAP